MGQKGLFVGIGAAGNKAVINLVEKGIIAKDDMLLINSTTDDIPKSYRDLAIKLEGSIGGCGKERTKAKNLALVNLKSGKLDLKKSVSIDHSLAVIIASMEGGTGSGATPLIAKYYSEVVKIKTHIIAFKGFGEDTRGWQNTVEFFQDLNKDITVQIIENSKFLDKNNPNKQNAERAADEEVCKRARIMLGLPLIDSEQNMDQMDMYKVVNTPGFMTIEYRELSEKIKNVKEFNDILTEMLDESKTVNSIIPSQKRLGAIINIPENERIGVDFMFNKVRERLGSHIYEYFTHFQYNESFPKFIAFISSGMNMPIDEVRVAFEKYEAESQAAGTCEDNFFSDVVEFKGNDKDIIFDMDIPELNSGSDDEFFNSFKKNSQQKKK